MKIGRKSPKSSGWKWRLLLVYLLLLSASYLVRAGYAPDPIPPDIKTVTVAAINGEKRTSQPIRLGFKEYKPEGKSDSSVVVLIHGSPGDHKDFRKLAPKLAQHRRVIVPDLPGFGSSSQAIPDYSIRAHARYVLELLDRLNVPKAHFVGYSMGGGVVLNVADIAPERVASLTMLSAIGVQELELLGNYYLNHSIHALQLGFLWLLPRAIPHFGVLDHAMINVSYARNFYDSDQRPLRDILSEYASPMLIAHGEQDMMAPVEAALESHRLVPQSELVLFPDENHFYLFGQPERQTTALIDFLERVEHGQAGIRKTADPFRAVRSSLPFDPSGIPRAMGPTALVIFFLLALATLISEDLTCVWAGVLAAQGRISFMLAAAACLAGIFLGDVLLFLAGRCMGRRLLRRAPLKWLVSEGDVERSSEWFKRRGMTVIMLSRFLPGTRLPTYFAAGLLDTGFLKFSIYFLIAASVWTPMLVGLSMLLGGQVIESALLAGQSVLLKLVVGILLSFIVIRLLTRLISFRGRRLLLGRLRRLIHWEFWPPWIFYPPLVLYIVYLGIKHRGFTLFTCANPAIEAGGFIAESKSGILEKLGEGTEARQRIARWTILDARLSRRARVDLARRFMSENSLSFPIVLKPDAGQRGDGVAVIRTEQQMLNYLRDAEGDDVIIQQYIGGLEFGVFYLRHPKSARGEIFSITRKEFPSVIGDGNSSLEQLILMDKRAICMARTYFEAQRDRLWDTPARGEAVQLIDLGTHCRGSIFHDGSEVATAAMRDAIDRLAKGFKGFYFGRFDIRTPVLSDFQRGDNFFVVELNGVTSEATHIYDSSNSLLKAYRVLFAQWRIAFEIGAENRARGVVPTPLRELSALVFGHWRRKSERKRTVARPIRSEAEMRAELASES